MAGPGNRRYGPACGDSCPDKRDACVLPKSVSTTTTVYEAEDIPVSDNGEEENADDDYEESQ
eukprot:9652133-Heterocapsa_arctica.AAC.1